VEKVKFKQFQALRDKAFLAFSQDTPLDTAAGSLEMMDSIVLAFVGDAWYAVTMRQQLVHTGVQQVQVLHTLASEFVSAKVQAYVYRIIQPILTDVEQQVCRRARNAYSQAPKSATVGEYHDSTALEALIGYLVLSSDRERLDYIMDQVMANTRQYCKEKHMTGV
jgi:23S rRNA maturation mini-RNase III